MQVPLKSRMVKTAWTLTIGLGTKTVERVAHCCYLVRIQNLVDPLTCNQRQN